MIHKKEILIFSTYNVLTAWQTHYKLKISQVKHASNTPNLPNIETQPEKKVKVAQLCPTLCHPVDYSLPGYSVCGILQARILEQITILFSRGSFPPRDRTRVSRTAGGFFTIWATREAPSLSLHRLFRCNKQAGWAVNANVDCIIYIQTWLWAQRW